MDIMSWWGMMLGCWRAIPESEKKALEEWEKVNLNGQIGTSNWPGWEKYIGKPPFSETNPVSSVKKRISASLRVKVWRRDNFRCVLCGSEEPLSVDHIVAESRGGSTTIENLQTLCRRCNSKKGPR